jgi:3-hydroxyisobutyrate dehydrogenase
MTADSTDPIRRVAFLGLGAMGQRMAARLLAQGLQLRVWNRHADADLPLLAAGAERAASPAAAVRDADLVFAMLSDDRASRAVWLEGEGAALPAAAPGSVLVECSTLTPAWVRELAGLARARKLALIDAPVAGSLPQAEAGQLVFFVAGEEGAKQRLQPALQAMASAVRDVGASGRAAETKLLVNGLFTGQLAALAEVLALGSALGHSTAELAALLGSLPSTSPAVAVAARLMAQGDERPLFPIALAHKDLGYLEALFAECAVSAPLHAATAGVFRNACEQGLGAANVSAVFRSDHQRPAVR